METARKLEQCADESAKQKFAVQDHQIAMSKAISSAISLLAPTGLNYLNFQGAGIEYGLNHFDVLIADEMGLGKSQPLSAKVVTPSGYREIGGLGIGDKIIGANGKVTDVTGIFPQGRIKVFKVVFTDGSSTKCSAEHLWQTFSAQNKWHNEQGGVRTLLDIQSSLKEQNGNLNHFIPITEPVEFDNRAPFPLHPYALGLIIGDGNFANVKDSTISLACTEQSILDRIGPMLPVKIQSVGNGIDYRLCDAATDKKQRSSENELTKIFRSLGMMGCYSDQKFIPTCYKLASIQDREELIRGLFDADGYRSQPEGTPIQFSSASKQLVDDVKFVLQSLGCIARYSYDDDVWFSYKGQLKKGKPCHLLTVNPRNGFEPFWLERKRRLTSRSRKYFPARGIKSVEYVGYDECVCIAVAAKDKLYLTDEFIVTHNTIQAIGIINNDPNPKPNVLIIPPASLLPNWEKELMKWMMKRLTGDFATGNKLPRSNIVLANYDIIPKLKEQILERKWDIIICDEAHYLKNPDAKRTMAVLGHEDTSEIKNCRALEATRRIMLTGTPILNRPVELWPLLRVFDPEGLGRDFWLFAKKFCAAEENSFGRDFSGASNLDILQQRLRSSFMIRRLKKDVLSELPPKRRQIIALPLPAQVKNIVQKELEFYENNKAQIELAILAQAKAQVAGDKESYNLAATALHTAKQASFEEMNKLRHDTAVAKIPYMINYLSEVLQEQDKIVVFAYHQDVIEAIHKHFQSISEYMHGGTDVLTRQLRVDRFRETEKCRMIIGSIGTMGVGWNLTESSYVVFAEESWVPAHITQAEDRTHRIGQLESVLIQHVVFDGSLDANMVKRVIEKQEIIDQALDDQV